MLELTRLLWFVISPETVVLELGAGVGLYGLVASSFRPKLVVLTVESVGRKKSHENEGVT